MKHMFRKKNLIWTLVAVLILSSLIGSTAFSLAQKAEKQMENPVEEMNIKRSQQLITGSGYSFDKDQEKSHNKQEKQRDKEYRDGENEDNDDSGKNAFGGKDKFGPGDGNKLAPGGEDNNNPKDQTDGAKGKPIIKSKELEKLNGKSRKVGKLNFSATIQNYKETENIPVKDITVTNNGKKVKLADDRGKSLKYETKINKGKNLIVIEANDTKNGTQNHKDYTITGVPLEANPPPEVFFNIKNGETLRGKSSLSFGVKATDYKDNAIPAYSHDKGSIKVWVDGREARSNDEKGGYFIYRVEGLEEGTYTIKAIATDKDGKPSEPKNLTVRYNPKENGRVEGKVTISLEAGTIGKGTFFTETVEIYKNEPLSDAVREVFGRHGYYSGSYNYIARISHSGITSGYKIPNALQKKLDAEGYTEMPHEPDALAQKHFTTKSGWMYQVNGIFPSKGMSQYYPDDDDYIRIRFTLWQGYDLKGTWGNW